MKKVFITILFLFLFSTKSYAEIFTPTCSNSECINCKEGMILVKSIELIIDTDLSVLYADSVTLESGEKVKTLNREYKFNKIKNGKLVADTKTENGTHTFEIDLVERTLLDKVNDVPVIIFKTCENVGIIDPEVAEKIALEKKQATCKTLGFKIGTESNGECVLKLMQMEIELDKIEEQKTVQIQNTDSTKTTETIANQTLEQQELIIRQQELNNSLILMQQGLSLLTPSPSIRCRNTIMGFTCN